MGTAPLPEVGGEFQAAGSSADDHDAMLSVLSRCVHGA
jgi:hypothetical protein